MFYSMDDKRHCHSPSKSSLGLTVTIDEGLQRYSTTRGKIFANPDELRYPCSETRIKGKTSEWITINNLLKVRLVSG